MVGGSGALGRSSNISPQKYARVGGILYLVIILAGMSGELLIRGPAIVSGNAAATAANISSSPVLWRVGIAGDLVMHLCDVGVMLVFYVLLSPVSRNLALLALLFNLIQTSVLVANKLNLLLPLFLLGEGEYLKAFSPEQRQALAYVALRTHDHGFALGLLFFGVECLIVGSLIVRARYLPSVFGYMMLAAGACYLTNSVALVLYPPLTSRLFPFILLPPFVAELSLAVRLLWKGVDLVHWPVTDISS